MQNPVSPLKFKQPLCMQISYKIFIDKDLFNEIYY